LGAPDPPIEHAEVPRTPDDYLADDEDLDDLPIERHLQLTIAAAGACLMSQRKAAIFYKVPHTTVQDRMNGALTRVDAHAHERRLTDVQEDILVEWIKV
jgi:hypothetical protein